MPLVNSRISRGISSVLNPKRNKGTCIVSAAVMYETIQLGISTESLSRLLRSRWHSGNPVLNLSKAVSLIMPFRVAIHSDRHSRVVCFIYLFAFTLALLEISKRIFIFTVAMDPGLDRSVDGRIFRRFRTVSRSSRLIFLFFRLVE